MKLLLVETVFSWGYMIRPPLLTGGGSSLPYPPPTTLLGALAYAYLKYRGGSAEIIIGGDKSLSPTYRLVEENMVEYAVIGYPRPQAMQIVDVNKYYNYAYLRPAHKSKKELWSGIVGMGKTFYPGTALILYMVNDDYAEELGKAAWNIIRIGSKEGLVTVRNSQIIDNYRVAGSHGPIETIFPAPEKLVDHCLRYCNETYFWKISREAYESVKDPAKIKEFLVKYYVPGRSRTVFGGKMKIVPSSQARIISFTYKDEEFKLIAPGHGDERHE